MLPPLIVAICDGAPFDHSEAIKALAQSMQLLAKSYADHDRFLPSDPIPEPIIPELMQLGLTTKTVATLEVAGIVTKEQLAQLSQAELSAIPGIGPATVALIHLKLTGKPY